MEDQAEHLANTKEIHDSFLEDQAEHLANTKEITKVTTVQQILHAECQMVTFPKLGTWLKGNEYAQLTWVLIPDDSTVIVNMTWKLIVEAQELYDILTKEGQLHYHDQAAETPLVNGPFAEKMCLLMITTTAMPFSMTILTHPILPQYLRSVILFLACITLTQPNLHLVLTLQLLVTTFSRQSSIHGNAHHLHHLDNTTAITKHYCMTLVYLDAVPQSQIFVSNGLSHVVTEIYS